MKYNDKDVWAIIPARSGSESLKNKNIHKINNIPMLAYSIAVAKKVKKVSKIIVSTDSKKYKKIAEKFGAEVPFLRPESLSKSNSKDIDFFRHLFSWFTKRDVIIPEYFLHLRPTSPIRNPKIIENALDIFIRSKYTSLRSVHRMSSTSYKTFEIKNNKLINLIDKSTDIEISNLPRQKFKDTYQANGYVDIVRSSLISKGILHGNKAKAFITEKIIDVDGIEELNYLKYIAKKNKISLNKLFQNKYGKK